MADTPISETVMAAVLTRFKAMTTGAGYHRTVSSSNVFRRYFEVSDMPSTPCVLIYMLEEETDHQGGGASIGTYAVSLPVVIVYLIEQYETDSVQTNMNQMRADITKAMGPEFEVLDADNKPGTITPVAISSDSGTLDGTDGVVWVAKEFELRWQRAYDDEARFL